MTEELYIPNRATIPEPIMTWRVALQGPPMSGKTWSALSFPNPIVLSIDNKVPRMHPLVIEGKIPELPFWSEEFLEKECLVAKPRKGPRAIHSGLYRWLEKNGPKFSSNQTLILDSLTFIGNNFDTFVDDNPSSADARVDWGNKNKYMIRLHRLIRALPCNWISILHEQPEYDNDGKVVGIKPMLTGSFKDQLAGSYTEWWRMQREKVGKEVHHMWRIKPVNSGTFGGLVSHCIPEEKIQADFSTLVQKVEENSKQTCKL